MTETGPKTTWTLNISIPMDSWREIEEALERLDNSYTANCECNRIRKALGMPAMDRGWK